MRNESEYKQIFTQLIKKQMLVLGPDITLAKVKNVPGIAVDSSGEVTSIQGEPQALLQSLINQFVELSGMIVKKTMESILTSYPGLDGLSVAAGVAGVAPSNMATPIPSMNTQTPQVAPVSEPHVQPISQVVSPPLPPTPPISMPSVEEMKKPQPEAVSQAPVFNQTVEAPKIEVPQHVEPAPQIVTPPPQQQSQPQQHMQQPISPEVAASEDLSPEEVEKLNKMIAEMNQMTPASGEEASKKE